VLDIALLPWRPRLRRIDSDDVRDHASWLEFDDLSGLVIGLVWTVVVLVAAPLIAVLLAALFLPVEIWIAATLGVLYVVARFTGVIPWTVITSEGTIERYRFLPTALGRIRSLNESPRPRVRWHWA